jgi:prophage regulatory protein
MSYSNHRVLKRRAVEVKTGLTRSALYDLISKGLFPRPIRLGLRSVGWIESEVDEWIAARMDARTAA